MTVMASNMIVISLKGRTVYENLILLLKIKIFHFRMSETLPKKIEKSKPKLRVYDKFRNISGNVSTNVDIMHCIVRGSGN